jgi:hypothetical protein
MEERMPQAEAGLQEQTLWDDLLPALLRVDALLAAAVERAALLYGTEPGGDPFRGLYVSEADAARLLVREPGGPALAPPDRDELPDIRACARLKSIARQFALSSFDVDVLLLALAPELDLRYERLFGYLHDDVARRRPSVDLALSVLAAPGQERIERRAHFLPQAPLFAHRLLRTDPPADGRSGFLSGELSVDEQALRLLLGGASLDTRLTGCCDRDVDPPLEAELPVTPEEAKRLRALLEGARAHGRGLCLHLRGPRGCGARTLARWLAASGGGVVALDLSRAAPGADFDELMELALREAWLHGALLCIERPDGGAANAVGLDAAVTRLVRRSSGVVLVTGADPLPGPYVPEQPLGLVEVELGVPEAPVRRRLWEVHASRTGIRPSPRQIDELASRFRLTPAQIAEAAAGAAAVRCGNGRGRVSREHLFAAARAQSGMGLAGLAGKIEPRQGWGDLVLPPDTVERLREICGRVTERERVLGEWGFEARLRNATGVTALFAGSSGTGKTLAAEVIAHELGLDLYRIDLSGVVSKYVGETEKNLSRVFHAAECSNAVLLFDEAEALFGKRSEVRDSHDRYANVEISYLLQRMEAYDGLAILTTNLVEHLDRAFARRLGFTVYFPFPGAAERRRLWRGVWPEDAPLDESVALDELAAAFRLSGGHIRNIALAAAFLAASNGGVITMDDLQRAARREHEKLGRRLSEEPAGDAVERLN